MNAIQHMIRRIRPRKSAERSGPLSPRERAEVRVPRHVSTSSRIADARQRGSVLLFSVIVVLLLTMMGAAYLQMARVDRRATRAVDTRSQDVDGSIIRFIANILAADLLQKGAEPYDYPWTNHNASFEVKDYLNPTGPSLGNAEGGEKDDMWLASTEPVFSGTDIDFWPHISNLRGVWLDLRLNELVEDDSGPETAYFPQQYTTTADANANRGDTNLPQSVLLATSGSADPLGADADGDGIIDSRWTWAPLPSELGRTYVMAVRIIDNSALANLNVWTQTAASGADQSRWYWPAELNLEPAFNAFTGGSAVFNDLISHRGLSTTPSFQSRYWYWLNGPRMGPVKYGDANDLTSWTRIGTGTELQQTDMGMPPGTTIERFGIIDELELRWRNGLNKTSDNSAVDADSPLEERASTIGAFLWRQNDLETKFDNVTPPMSQRQFFENEPRKHFTTISGAGLRWKTNLNAVGTQAQRERLAKLAADVAALALPTQGAIDASTPAWSAEDFGNQFAATVADWIDYREVNNDKLPDNTLTKVGDRYGMEYLPFISEVFVQRDYSAPGGEDPVTWTQAGAPGYIIEIVNPFNTPIPLAGLTLQVNGEDWGDVATLFAADEMQPNEMLRIYRDGGAGFPAVTGELTDQDWPTSNDFDPITVELLVPTTEDPIVYHRFAARTVANSFTTPANAPYNTATAAVARVHAVGTGNGLNALTVREVDVQFNDVVADDLVADVEVHAGPSVSEFTGNWDAPIKGNSTVDNRLGDAANVADSTPHTGMEPFVIGNAGRIYRAGDIARMVFVGPTDGKPFPEMWNAATHVKDHMLDFAETTTMAGIDHEEVNASILLLSRLTTLSPENRNAWPLVPGTININTAPERVLDWALPDFHDKDVIVDAIIDGRDAGGLRDPQTGRTEPGFAHLGELVQKLSTTSGYFDANEYEADVDVGDPDGYTGDMEELTAGLANLNQVLTTRSDVFTAYVVVRGYASNDFRTVVDEYRLIAVFDRSGVTEARPMARVLGVAVVRQP